MSKRGMTAAPGEVTWHCPYCDESYPTLRELQHHITETTTGEHEGISGESPDEDLIATNENGDEADVYEATSVVRPKGAPLQDTSKRKQLVYAWLASGREEDADALAAVTDADRDYAQQILAQIRRGEISREYWADDMDHRLLKAMEERLDEYNSIEDTQAESESDMSTQQPDTDVEESTEDVPEGVNSKTLVLNAFDLTGPGVTVKEVWEAMAEAGVFDSGYEYFRRTWAEARDGDIPEEEIESAVDEQIQAILEHVLAQSGVLGQSEASETAETVEEETTATQELSASVSASQSTRSGEVSVQEVKAVREKVELLREQAEFEGGDEDSAAARRAEFLGMKTVEWLDELIDQADQQTST